MDDCLKFNYVSQCIFSTKQVCITNFAQVKEHHRRDGFEVGNADKIFESTYTEQLTRKAA